MTDNWQKSAIELHSDGYSYRAIGRLLGKNESVVRRYLNRIKIEVDWEGGEEGGGIDGSGIEPYEKQREFLDIENFASYLKAQDKAKPVGAKVLFLDLEVSASIVAAFSMFKHFSTPDHVMQFPYILSFAANWLHDKEEDVYAVHLADFDMFEEDHANDKELVMRLWQFLEEADIVVIHNAIFDVGWFSQRCAYWDLPEPSPYRVCCTVKGLKKSMSLPSNSLGYSTKYFNLGHEKLKHDGISLWIRCMAGEIEALDLMKQYNVGDIPTLRQLYLKIRAWIPNHPNIALYYGDSTTTRRCGVCGSTNLEKLETKAYTNLSIFNAYRCGDCGTVKRDGERQQGQSKHYMRTIGK